MKHRTCQDCGHVHYEGGSGPCKSCLCTRFAGLRGLPARGLRGLPTNSYLRLLAERDGWGR